MVNSKKPSEMDGALIVGDDDTHARSGASGASGASSASSASSASGASSASERRGDADDIQEDGKAELATEMVDEIVSRMGLDLTVEIREDADEVILDLQGPDAGRAIGKKGQTLDALQFLINKIVNRFPEGRRHVLLDSGDYRERRESGLASLARREAKRAVQQSRVITLEPMSPRDRRVVHLSLAKVPDVSTRSDGQGAERRVRIIPARQGRERSSRR